MSDFITPEDEQYRIPGTDSYLIPPDIIKKRKQLSNQVVYGASREKDLDGSHIIYATVTVGGEEILKHSHFSLSIDSKISRHDRFEILCPSEEFAETSAYPLSNSKYVLGKRCTIQFKQLGISTYLFTGIITEIENRRIDGYSHIVLIGSSPTILLDNGENCCSFENLNLSEIMSRILAGYPTDRVQGDLRPHAEDKLPYIVQYNQSDWQFLRSLCARYGENLFYNGKQIVLGGWGGKTVELFEEQDFFEYRLQMKLAPQAFEYTAYDYNRAENLKVHSEENSLQPSKNPFQQFAQETSEKIFTTNPKKHYAGSFSEADNRELNRAVRRKQLENKNVAVVEMKTQNPNLRLGDIIKLHGWIAGHKIFKDGNVPLESYKIIEISHEFKDGEGYYNRLKAIPKDMEVVPVEEIPQAVCETQPAVVTDNKDPKGMGRIRVRFAWQSANEQSPWIRQMQPHGGAGKGFYFIPEIAEEVLIGFEDHNPERPYVLGTRYNGKEISGFYTPDNRFKVIKTHSGHYLEFEEFKNITLADTKGNKFHIDSQGDCLNIEALKDITLNAGRNININAQRDINIVAGQDMNTNVGGNSLLRTGMNYLLKIFGMMKEEVSGDIESYTENKRKIISKDRIDTYCDEEIKHNSQSVLKNNSNEKNQLF